ncbi:hypothetical protein R3P38DRAFT_2843152 [Favolaschia claudopus]|uniref:DUF5648 domain-containing protein n=1 Tax=Favolaschia claudopus TaxID=2862362 RepID=A0AAW0E246_9AGAR
MKTCSSLAIFAVSFLLSSITAHARSVKMTKRIDNCPEIVGVVNLHRQFHHDKEHYVYTTNSSEVDRSAVGYEYDGVLGGAFEKQEASTVPLYHIYNDHTQANFYTTDEAERESELSHNLANVDRGIAAFVLSKRACGSKPLFRQFNPATGNHFLTTDEEEVEYALTDRGYEEPIISGFVMQK